VYGFWSVEVLGELTDRHSGCGEVARVGVLLVRNCTVNAAGFILDKAVDQSKSESKSAIDL
jgi:hypothetical protein